MNGTLGRIRRPIGTVHPRVYRRETQLVAGPPASGGGHLLPLPVAGCSNETWRRGRVEPGQSVTWSLFLVCVRLIPDREAAPLTVLGEGGSPDLEAIRKSFDVRPLTPVSFRPRAKLFRLISKRIYCLV